MTINIKISTLLSKNSLLSQFLGKIQENKERALKEIV